MNIYTSANTDIVADISYIHNYYYYFYVKLRDFPFIPLNSCIKFHSEDFNIVAIFSSQIKVVILNF